MSERTHLAKGALVYRVLQCLSSTELRHLSGLDLDRFARSRVAAGACGACAGVESAEADQGHFVALAQAGLHRVDERVDRPLGGGLGDLRRLSDLLDEVRFAYGRLSAVGSRRSLRRSGAGPGRAGRSPAAARAGARARSPAPCRST